MWAEFVNWFPLDSSMNLSRNLGYNTSTSELTYLLSSRVVIPSLIFDTILHHQNTIKMSWVWFIDVSTYEQVRAKKLNYRQRIQPYFMKDYSILIYSNYLSSYVTRWLPTEDRFRVPLTRVIARLPKTMVANRYIIDWRMLKSVSGLSLHPMMATNATPPIFPTKKRYPVGMISLTG